MSEQRLEKVFVIYSEEGQYDDYRMDIEGVAFTTNEAADAHILYLNAKQATFNKIVERGRIWEQEYEPRRPVPPFGGSGKLTVTPEYQEQCQAWFLKMREEKDSFLQNEYAEDFQRYPFDPREFHVHGGIHSTFGVAEVEIRH